MKARLFLIGMLLAGCGSTTVLAQGTVDRPFSDRSLWNSRPSKFKLGTEQVPKSDYFPTVAEGAYSVRVFVAKATDTPMSVSGPSGSSGIYVADAESVSPTIVIPHWPSDVTPATGTDGHADIVDVSTNRIHSFFQLRFEGGNWRATQYAWTSLDGRGWGDPAHYQQGARAAGVPTMAGLIRTAELNDGQPAYRHALAMSMTFNALSADPTYVFPATSADINAAKVNHGTIPEGALVMLPADFDLKSIKNPALLKIARTLQSYGAYVVDANQGTPFLIYVEIGSKFSLMPWGRWDNEIASELDLMRAGLRPVKQVTEYVDAKGKPFVPERNLNLLSMRGPWQAKDGGTLGSFDTWQQAVVFPGGGRPITQTNTSGRNLPSVAWAVPKPGATYRLKITASSGATLRLDLVDSSNKSVFSSETLGNGGSAEFKWPAADLKSVVTISSGAGGDGKIGASLTAAETLP